MRINIGKKAQSLGKNTMADIINILNHNLAKEEIPPRYRIHLKPKDIGDRKSKSLFEPFQVFLESQNYINFQKEKKGLLFFMMTRKKIKE